MDERDGSKSSRGLSFYAEKSLTMLEKKNIGPSTQNQEPEPVGGNSVKRKKRRIRYKVLLSNPLREENQSYSGVALLPSCLDIRLILVAKRGLKSLGNKKTDGRGSVQSRAGRYVSGPDIFLQKMETEVTETVLSLYSGYEPSRGRPEWEIHDEKKTLGKRKDMSSLGKWSK